VGRSSDALQDWYSTRPAWCPIPSRLCPGASATRPLRRCPWIGQSCSQHGAHGTRMHIECHGHRARQALAPVESRAAALPRVSTPQPQGRAGGTAERPSPALQRGYLWMPLMRCLVPEALLPAPRPRGRSPCWGTAGETSRPREEAGPRPGGRPRGGARPADQAGEGLAARAPPMATAPCRLPTLSVFPSPGRLPPALPIWCFSCVGLPAASAPPTPPPCEPAGCSGLLCGLSPALSVGP